jgi:hypothetical protein
MTEALAWRLEYLSRLDDPRVAAFTSLYAMTHAMRGSITKICRRVGTSSTNFYLKRRCGLATIAAGLTTSGKAPT